MIKNSNLAPILIPTLNRYGHLKRCLDSLAQNTHAQESLLYIALDAPTKKEHEDGYNKIIEYLDQVSSFKEVIIIKRDRNLGPIKNTLTSLDELFKKYDQIILSEDDNFFSPNFLDYMNKCLQRFEDRKDVFAICGYNYPMNIPSTYPNNVYLGERFAGWGCGLWKNKYEAVELSVGAVSKFLNNFNNFFKLVKTANYLLPKLFDMVEKDRIAGDAIFIMNMIKKKMFCVFPTVSKVRNYGNDGTGANCHRDEENIFVDQPIDNTKLFNFSNSDKLVENEELTLMLRKEFMISRIEIVKRIFLFLTRNTNLHKYYKKIKKFFKN